MKFLIVTHTPHKKSDHKLYAYEPYVREMNLWIQNTSETRVVAPIVIEEPRPIDAPYDSSNITSVKIPQFNFTNTSNAFLSLLKLPLIFFRIMKNCYWADHIHLRCPGNVGFIGVLVQIFFPKKIKTVKYAGNWDPNSKQPLSYRWQKKILSNTFLTKNCKVLVYGEWKNSTKNIHPFFTASYKTSEIEEIDKSPLSKKVKLIYVGALTKSKQPLLSLKVVEQLKKVGFELELNIYGNGSEYENLASYIKKNNLNDVVILHGNQNKEIVKKAFQESHFLLFLSKSEGWPKVVAEAMFWGCIPISSKVSCIPFMLGNGSRGALVEFDVEEIVQVLKTHIENTDIYQSKMLEAQSWSQKYTLDYFSSEIKNLLQN